MYFITTKRMLEVCFSVHPNIQYRTVFLLSALRLMVLFIQFRPLPLSHFFLIVLEFVKLTSVVRNR